MSSAYQQIDSWFEDVATSIRSSSMMQSFSPHQQATIFATGCFFVFAVTVIGFAVKDQNANLKANGKVEEAFEPPLATSASLGSDDEDDHEEDDDEMPVAPAPEPMSPIARRTRTPAKKSTAKKAKFVEPEDSSFLSPSTNTRSKTVVSDTPLRRSARLSRKKPEDYAL